VVPVIYEFQLLQVEISVLNIPCAHCILHLCFLVHTNNGLFVKPKHVAVGYKKYMLCLKTVKFIGFYILTPWHE
jgi:hypothetical protein